MERRPYQGEQKSTPAPIFTRKRPRQALLAHPNNPNSQQQRVSSYSTRGGGDVSQRQPAPRPDLNQQQFRQQAFRPTNQHGQQQMVRPASRPMSNISNTYTNNTWGATQGYQQGMNNRNRYQQPDSFQNEFASHQNTMNNQPPPNAWNPDTPVNYLDTPEFTGSFNMQSGTSQYPSGRSGTSQYPSGTSQYPNRPSGTSQYPSGQGGVPAPATPQYGHQAWGAPTAPTHPGQHNQVAPSLFHTQGSTSHRGHTQPHVTNTQLPETQVRKDGNQRNSEKNTVDGSLRILPASIQGMKHWAQYKHKIAMMFEIIGVVSSAVSNSQMMGGKEFVMKDEKGDQLMCIYYEIDRVFPRIVRGQWYRCVGTYEVPSDKLKCVCLRPTSEAEKRQCAANITAADKSMRAWVQSARRH